MLVNCSEKHTLSWSSIQLKSRHSHFRRRESQWKFLQRAFVPTTGKFWNIHGQRIDMKRVEEDLSRAHCPVMAPSQPEGFGAEGKSPGLKIDRNCLPGSLLHWTTFEVNIKATFPAQAGFSSRLITVEQSLTCGRPEAHFAPEETRPKASKDEEGATLGSNSAFSLSCCHPTNII